MMWAAVFVAVVAARDILARIGRHRWSRERRRHALPVFRDRDLGDKVRWALGEIRAARKGKR